MIDVERRPDPDELLARERRADEKRSRGALRLFFGFAPGVGKTYRMLQIAQALRMRGARDVVIGVVEDHRRKETSRLTDGLERLPLRKLEHRGRSLEEFDLDGALARSPDVLLVDELAHSNVPGSRHPKRWQDVEELLSAGIDVLTTMNVQHVESLHDVIHQITGVRVRETVPDAFLDRADTIELVDIAPEELMQRLGSGKIYIGGERADRAAKHFFQRGNLLALRELALRRTAQHVDDDVRAYRQEHGVETPWPSGERILVCVSAAPSSLRLVRAAARMAAGLRAPWVAAWVESDRPLDDASRARLEEHLRVAESLGATITRLTGPRIAPAILRFARKANVTRIVLGKPTHSRVRDWLRGSLLDDVVRGSSDLEVHVLPGEPSGESPAPAAPPRPRDLAWGPYAIAALAVALTTAIGFGLQRLLHLPDVEMLFLLAIMSVALRFGRGPALAASLLAVACFDFFFVPPVLTFSVEDHRYVLTFAMMFVVGLIMSHLAGRVRTQERQAHEREKRTASLFALSRELVGADTREAIGAIASKHLAAAFDARATIVHAKDDAMLAVDERLASLGPEAVRVALWTFDHDAIAGLGTDTLPGAPSIATPLRAGASRLGALVLTTNDGRALAREQRSLLDVQARQIALALERARLASEARSSALRAEAEEMRSSLLATVSHDLRTPLASITGAATTLRSGEGLAEATKRELVDAVVEQARRMERLVTNLLDMTRLDGAVKIHRDWYPADELVGSALTVLEGPLEKRKVDIDVEPNASLFVDPVLFDQLLFNLVENALEHTPPESPIEITVKTRPGVALLGVRDHGPGIPEAALGSIFDKFVRAAPANTAGAGLGLAICKGIAQAHGGTISATNLHGVSRMNGGVSFEVVLPLPAR